MLCINETNEQLVALVVIKISPSHSLEKLPLYLFIYKGHYYATMKKACILYVVLLMATTTMEHAMRTALGLPSREERSVLDYQDCAGGRCLRGVDGDLMIQPQQQEQMEGEQQAVEDLLMVPGPHEKRRMRSDISCANGACDHRGGGGGASDANKVKATNIAQKAAQEAKAASEAQQVAAQQASHQVKVQLAEKAQEAAEAAMAALAGKQQLVDELESEVREAQEILQEENAALQAAQQNAQSAMTSAQQAEQELKVLSSAIQLEKSAVGNAETTAQGAQQEVVEKTQVLDAAKRRVEALTNDLNSARADLANTKAAANKAAQAAQAARTNAARNRRRLRGSQTPDTINGPAVLPVQGAPQQIRRRRRRYYPARVSSAA